MNAARRALSTPHLAAIALLFGCGEDTSGPAPGPKHALAFTVHPTSSTVGAVLDPAVQVEWRDSTGQVAVMDSVPVRLTLFNDTTEVPNSLQGTLFRTPVNGVVTFDDVRMLVVGSGFVLHADGQGSSTISQAFTVVPGPAVAFEDLNGQGPYSAHTGDGVDLHVLVRDAYHNGISGVRVKFAVTSGSGCFEYNGFGCFDTTVEDTTVEGGVVGERWLLGLGANTVEATTPALPGARLTFTATGTP